MWRRRLVLNRNSGFSLGWIFMLVTARTSVTHNTLLSQIKLDIMPDKGWSTPDMFVPPGYHMGASISDTEQTEKEHGEQPFTYAPNMGLGYVMMNGCYGTNYTPSDPCYNAKFASPICLVRETTLDLSLLVRFVFKIIQTKWCSRGKFCHLYFHKFWIITLACSRLRDSRVCEIEQARSRK